MITILTVDDRAENREFITTLLEHRGYRLLDAQNGEQGLEITRREKPDLVITDVLMPRMDGYEFVRQLRADRGVADTRLLFYTSAYLEPEARRLAKACGVLRVLVKPSEAEEVLIAVDEALGLEASVPMMPSNQEFVEKHQRLLTDKLAERVVELEAEVLLRRQTEVLLENACIDLERRVLDRTSDLTEANAELNRKVAELNAALAEVHTLSGLLPICASCKNIRDDEGYWSQLETYFLRHSEVKFSHGICPECFTELYPDLLPK